MRRVLLTMLTVGLAMILAMAGCESDSTTNPSNEGSTDDPSYQLFIEEYEIIDELTEELLGIPFELSDEVEELRLGQAARIVEPPVWHEVSSFWYWSWEDTDNDGYTWTVVDSAQFKHGAEAVQYPLQASLTSIHSYATVTVTGPDIDTAYGVQNVVIVPHATNPDWAVVNGTGELIVQFTDTSELAGVDICTVTLDFNSTFTNVTFDPSWVFDDTTQAQNHCVISGTVANTGTVEAVCTGEVGGTLGGTWTVTESFNNGIISTVVTDGTTQWSGVDDCSNGVDEAFSGDDSVFVSEILDDGAFEPVLNTQELSYALITSYFSDPPTKGGEGAKYGENITVYIGTYEYTNGWHVFTFEATVAELSDTLDLAGTDSVKVMIDEVPVEVPGADFEPEAISCRSHYELTDRAQTISASIHHSLDAETIISGSDTLLQMDATTDDSFTLIEEGIGGTCTTELGSDVTIIALVFDPNDEGACPTSGSMTMASTVSVSCTGEGNELNVDGSWTVSLTANGDGTVTISYSNGWALWTVTEYCGAVQQGSSWVPGRW
ncbi:MAG: hypothetical protein V3T31_01165 [candidate division Zixibacteria bacterium]